MAEHSHSDLDYSVLTTRRGLWAVKWSFIALICSALLQLAVVFLSRSAALLADTIHNFADATTAVPLGVAFMLTRLKPNDKFTYGYGRVEDLAGVIIVLIIFISAVFAAYESIVRFLHPVEVKCLGALSLASLIGFGGNEIAAFFRIRVGKEIGSAALIADGQHARLDGITSLSVMIGAAGVWAGYPVADSIVGLLIALIILKISWDSARSVFIRLFDGIDPTVIHEIRQTLRHTKGVLEVTEVRARWIGHRIHAEVNVAVDSTLSVNEGHEISQEVRHELFHHLSYLSNVTVHIDPAHVSGEIHHRHFEH